MYNYHVLLKTQIFLGLIATAWTEEKLLITERQLAYK